MNTHHPSCPARDTAGATCICPLARCGDCGADGGWHALSCPFWDDHCRKCAGSLVDVAVHVCDPLNASRCAVVAPCTENPNLFDSTGYDEHMEAREICAGCACRAACLDLAGPASSGTFGGCLFANGRMISAGGVNTAATPVKDGHDGRTLDAPAVPAPPAVPGVQS